MLSLYLHIPFCKRKCRYCAFHSAPACEIERYTAAMEQAIARFGKEAKPLSTLYLGGGTPALLGAQNIKRLIECARSAFGFKEDIEITMELNPESTDLPLLKALKESGANRLSLGVQSLQDKELSALGRLHDAKRAEEALKMIFEAGFANVSADVMYGIPEQTEESFGETLDRLLAFPLTHLSAYSLQIEEGTPLYESGLAPMEEEQEERLHALLCQKAKEQGLIHYEISNFGKEGYFSRHNLAYWRRTDYLGLGPSAHSFYQGVRYAYPADTEGFIKDPLTLQDPLPIGEEEAREEQILLGLRTIEGVPMKLLPQSLDLAPLRPFITIHGDRLALNEKGFRLSNYIIGEILSK